MSDSGPAKADNGSISRRLLLATALSLPLFLFITGYAIDQSHGESLLTSERARLQVQMYGLLGALDFESGWPTPSERLKEPRFWQVRSGLYANVVDLNGNTLWESVSASSVKLPPTLAQTMLELTPGQEYFDEVDYGELSLFRYRYRIIWEDESGAETPMLIQMFSSTSQLRKASFSFRRGLLFSLGTVAILFFGLQVFILRWGLKPLRVLALDLQHLEEGRHDELQQQYPSELSRVTQILNRFIGRERQQRERYRNTLADLAHSLKTPLTVLRGALPGDNEQANQQLQRMDEIIAYQLQRPASAGRQNVGKRTPLHPPVQRLLDTLNKVHAERGIDAKNLCRPDFAVPVDEGDLLEMLGNLLENAYKAAASRVEISAGVEADFICIHIDDDGPGMEAAEVEQLTERGRRGDEYGPGHGLGLSIVKDIINACDGELVYSTSALGGARASLQIPAARD